MKITIEPTKDLSPTSLVAGLGFITFIYDIPPLWRLWTEAYPLDPMTEKEAAIVTLESVYDIEGMQLYSPDDVSLILDGLAEVGLGELAEVARSRLGQSLQ